MDVVEVELDVEVLVEPLPVELLLVAGVELVDVLVADVLVADVLVLVVVVLGGGHDSEVLATSAGATPAGRVSDDIGAPGGSGR